MIIILLFIALIAVASTLAILSYKLIKSMNDMSHYNDGITLAKSECFQFSEDSSIFITEHPGLKRDIYILYSPVLEHYLRLDKESLDRALANANKLEAERRNSEKKKTSSITGEPIRVNFGNPV